MNAAVEFKNVDIVFGRDRASDALAMIDEGADRAEILEKTGAVLGCAGANLTVNEGEISVLMGLSGSGKSTLLRAVNLLNVAGARQRHGQGRRAMVDVVALRRRDAAADPPACASPWCSSSSRCCRGGPSRRMSASGSSLPACRTRSARRASPAS